METPPDETYCQCRDAIPKARRHRLAQLVDTADLIACPQCDTLYVARMPAAGDSAVCMRCHHTLIAPRRDGFVRAVALSATVVVLVMGVTMLPFLAVNVMGFSNRASVIDTALAFVGEGWEMVLVFVVIGCIVLAPLARALLVIYTLVPLTRGWAPWPRARDAFRWAESLRPWSMAEIFVIGCAVALTKIASLARIDFGPAFWMFAALVIVVVLQDRYTDRYTIWRALERAR